MNDKRIPLAELLFVCVGEAVVSLITVLIYIALNKFNYSVVTGVLLGSTVIILNFIFLCISINRAIDNIMAERGDAEMDEQQAAEFSEKHKASLNKTVQLSNTLRMLSMVGALVLAFVLGHFDVIATLVPIVMYHPLILVSGLITKKGR